MTSDSATNIKNQFSAYLDRVKRGETVLILEYGRPIAQLTRPLVADASDEALSHLEREGLVAPPRETKLDVQEFLKNRPKLGKSLSVLHVLQKEREESR